MLAALGCLGRTRWSAADVVLLLVFASRRSRQWSFFCPICETPHTPHPSGEQRIKSRNPPPFSLFSPPPRVLCRVPPYPCRGRHVRRLCCAVLGRAERETAYDSRKGDMAKWVAPVQANRQAETLDFAPAVCLYVLMMDVPLAAILELVLTARREVVGLDLPPAAYVHA